MKTCLFLSLLFILASLAWSSPVEVRERDLFDPVKTWWDGLFGGGSPSTTAPASTSSSIPTVTSAKVTKTTPSTKTISTDRDSTSTVISTVTSTTRQPSSTTTDDDSSTTSSSTITTPSTTTTTSTFISTTSSVIQSTTEPPPAPTAPSNPVSSPPQPQSNSNRVSTAGIVVAAIMAIAVAVTSGYLIIRFCPPFRRRYEARQEKKRQARAYRPALDDNFASAPGTEKGLGLGDVESLKSRPVSYLFSPRLKQEVRRKPLPWSNDSAQLNKSLPPLREVAELPGSEVAHK